MRKISKWKLFAVSSLTATLICMSVPVQKVQAAEEVPGVPSVCYLAMDVDTGEVLVEKNADVTVAPASTTKLVTAMVICDVLPMDTPITVTQEMLDRVPGGTSKAGVRAGGTYYGYELLAMLLIPSGADAAQVLAETAYGSADACVVKMNEKVAELGLSNTYFDNIYGLDIGDGYPLIHTTARDFAVITKHALTYDWIRIITAMPQYALPARTNNDVIGSLNTNQFLNGKKPYSTDLYQVIGTKTGTTRTAGNVLAATATNGKKTVICTCFYNPNADVLYGSVKQIFDYVYLQEAVGE
ncbi:MAG: D-alanyl-D-alanine carboxypeptidase [Clostridiales bacterium]|nr:D-alanyl-D-alanine carboxypeptidase [Clostridiales bacterium]